ARARTRLRLPRPILGKPKPAVRKHGDHRRASAVRGLAAHVQLAVTELEPVANAGADQKTESHRTALAPRPHKTIALAILEHRARARLAPSTRLGDSKHASVERRERHVSHSLIVSHQPAAAESPRPDQWSPPPVTTSSSPSRLAYPCISCVSVGGGGRSSPLRLRATQVNTAHALRPSRVCRDPSCRSGYGPASIRQPGLRPSPEGRGWSRGGTAALRSASVTRRRCPPLPKTGGGAPCASFPGRGDGPLPEAPSSGGPYREPLCPSGVGKEN